MGSDLNYLVYNFKNLLFFISSNENLGIFLVDDKN